MDMNSARNRPTRHRLRYYAASSYPDSEPGLATSDHARRLRRWGFAMGLALVAVGVACAWAVTVLTGAAALGTPPSSTTSAPVTSTPASP